MGLAGNLRRRFPNRPGPSPSAATGTLASACYAPHSALYLEPDGRVKACCATGFRLGRVQGAGRQSLRQIWEGAAITAQRTALEAHSFEYGCQECELGSAAAGRDATTAVHFDRFGSGSPHPYPQLLDLALSNRCNLACVMCSGDLSSTIRSQREHLPPLPSAYDDAFFEELWEFLPHAKRLQFKGGEPFLARENRRIWDRLLETGHRPEISVTTNGTILNKNVERYLRELRMEPIISIDGMTAPTQESIRVGSSALRVWRTVDRVQLIAEEVGLTASISMCFMVENWREALPFLEEADRRGINGTLIFVNQPHRHDVLRLPMVELEAVLRELESKPVDFKGPLAPRHQARWAMTLQRLRAQLEQPVELVLRSPRKEPPIRPGAGAIDQRRQALTNLGAEPLELVIADQRLQRVVVPSWAGWLEPTRWVGSPVDTLSEWLEARVGPIHVVGSTVDDQAVAITQVELSAADRTRIAIAHRVEEIGGDHRIFLVGDLGPPGSPTAFPNLRLTT